MAIERKSIRRMLIPSFFGVLPAALVYFVSFYYSPEITICEFAFTIEEGLVVVTVPLVAHDNKLPYVNSVYMYSRENGQWKIPNTLGGKAGMRSWIAFLNAPTPPGTYTTSKSSSALNFDFGYCDSEWYRPERPGASLSIIAPLWIPFCMAVMVYFVFSFGYIRFSIRSLLFFTMVAAILIGFMV